MTAPVPDVDKLAQEIRRVDGDNSLGAGALAEALMPFLAAPLSTRPGEELTAAAEINAALKNTAPSDRSPREDGAYYGSILQLSTNKMLELETAFQYHRVRGYRAAKAGLTSSSLSAHKGQLTDYPLADREMSAASPVEQGAGLKLVPVEPGIDALREVLRQIAGGHDPRLSDFLIAGNWPAAFGVLQSIASEALAAAPITTVEGLNRE